MNETFSPSSVLPASSDDSALGFVYLLKRNDNSAVIKIGYTAKSAESRASNYTDGAWFVHKEYPMPVWLAKLTERSAHAKLASFWLDPKLTGGSASEIFTCPLDDGDIAIQLSYMEHLEKSIRLLGLPDVLVKIILKEAGLSSEMTISALEKRLDFVADEQRKEKKALVQRIGELEDTRKRQEEIMAQAIQLLESDKKSLVEKVEALEAEIKTLRQYIKSAGSDFSKDIDMLGDFADKKINIKDFEILRSNFRKTIEIVRLLRIKSGE